MSQVTDYVASNPRAILVTRRRDGGLQASPIRVLVDDGGAIVASTRAATAKARNLTRDPRFTLCVITEKWSGAWMTLEGEATVHHMPEALPRLRAFAIQRDGSIPDEDGFAETAQQEGRVLLEFRVERSVTPPARR